MALVLLSTPHGRDGSPTGDEGGIPDSAASPDDFFVSPEETPARSPSPPADEHDSTLRDDDRVEAPSPTEPSDDATEETGDGSSGSSSGDTTADAVVELVNEERANAGCAPVRPNDALTRAAEKHSEDMAARGYMAHESPDGTTPADRAAREGYHAWSGENVAAGYDSPEDVMEGWMNSRGHRENILNCENTAIGVGEHRNRWTQMFGSD
ncbi:CAP domain-containing protein [Halostreptopolyspora alba]|uniref:CAP domain-containing protein n=2 Tax=Halostreptopolyspora alba TaxID=2487137 RepID=A0A3N0EE58_9ACTN|nr:CAP domain-containing protein [Nocardiopsaceae bacterium YIM 96095]